MFRLPSGGLAAATTKAYSLVKLKQITCSLDPQTGEPDFIDTAATMSVQIQNTSFARGAMKLAFDVSTVCSLAH